ncbi:hypothetical protein LZ575_20825 [Antarcticibacterium sp. 1MA-6-2]|uniref:hypothetical protein n=1 Tax=Antarcticibacterium sp. 1MA-6-2 TaxID=2908210 RepID=UPI001F323736|nr:hypothetical protein [Antarcticibacterium sp. 1MA-6-2]UJH91073.1 hypothetical protein LZ575_20825 [Antarcticibacterium sp. 1MA-6-2]
MVVKELLCAVDIDSALMEYYLEGIEPFIIILVDWSDNLRFIEFVWDGNLRHIQELPLEAHIWSSSPLYDEAMRQSRLKWFKDFLKTEASSENLLKFHHSGGEGNPEVDLIMDRGFVKTQSITQIINFQHYTKMVYEDLTTGIITEREIKT